MGWQNLGDNDLVLADNINIASNSLIHVQKINQMSSVDYINCGETITFYGIILKWVIGLYNLLKDFYVWLIFIFVLYLFIPSC